MNTVQDLVNLLSEIDFYLNVSVEFAEERYVSSQFLYEVAREDLLRLHHIALRVALSMDDEKKLECLKAAVYFGKSILREILRIHVVFSLNECERFQNDYRSISIIPFVNSYSKDCGRLNTILEQVEHGAVTNDLKIFFDEIPKILKCWTDARSELDKEVRKARRAFYTQALVWATGVATIIGVVITVKKWFLG